MKWTREELKKMDRRTMKLMTMHKALHPRDDSFDASIQRLEGYIEKYERGLITAIKNDTD